jgi:molybdate/tungstate transport system substrate-binding protein
MNTKMIVAIVIIVIAILGVGVYGYNTYIAYSEKGTIIIYAADSLGQQLNSTANKFESQHPNVNVQIHYMGSSAAIRQITDLNKTADIVASADYGLIDKQLIPDYTSFNLKYARNEMVIAYTDKSKNSSQINSNNWYQIFSQNNVKFGFSDPNSDPAGYRAVMMIQLANTYYNNSTIFDNLVAKNSAIISQVNGTGYVVNCPTNLNPGSKIMIRPDVAQMMPSLQSDAIDYLITYKSLAAHAGVKYITLPAMLQLSNTTYEPDYKKIHLIQFSGTSKSKTLTLTPIVYGITVLSKAPQKQLAIEFVQLLLSPTGTQIIKDSFQEPISPAIATVDSTNIPNALQQYVVTT